jgi:hypothetical protein
MLHLLAFNAICFSGGNNDHGDNRAGSAIEMPQLTPQILYLITLITGLYPGGGSQ